MKKLLKDKEDADKVVSYIRDGTETLNSEKILLWNYIKKCKVL